MLCRPNTGGPTTHGISVLESVELFFNSRMVAGPIRSSEIYVSISRNAAP